jgi:hypothetical protein
VAPRIFPTYWEYHLALAACCGLTLIAWRRDGFTPLAKFVPGRWVWRGLGVLLGALVVALASHAWYTHGRSKTVLAVRNFYGALRVQHDVDDSHSPEPVLQLTHGQINHGFQYLDESRRRRPTTYYAPQTGVALAIDLCRRQRNEGLRIGVVGLGAGTIAAHGRRGDVVRFYEINPQVYELSCPGYFTFLQDSAAEVEVVLGDARMCMEQELRAGQPQAYDVLAVDAFSSDSIPIHLLTRECGKVYWRHLKPGGVLAIHISNRFLDLGPVTRGLAEALPGCRALAIDNSGDNEGGDASNWVLLTSSPRLLVADELAENAKSGIDSRVTSWTDAEQPIVWTDDFHSLLPIIRWR